MPMPVKTRSHPFLPAWCRRRPPAALWRDAGDFKVCVRRRPSSVETGGREQRKALPERSICPRKPAPVPKFIRGCRPAQSLGETPSDVIFERTTGRSQKAGSSPKPVVSLGSVVL